MNSYILVPHNDSVYEFAICNEHFTYSLLFINFYPFAGAIPQRVVVDQLPEGVWDKLVNQLP